MPNSGNIATISGNLLTDSGIDLSTKADLVGGLIPSSQLPSYVDDVLEFANLAGFPATGETGKIYVALDTNETYRWSGSAYIRIANGAVQSVNSLTGNVTLTTSNIAEGTNLYYTDGRARNALSASGSLNYSASTGQFSYTTPNSDGISEGSTNLYFTNARARAAISVSGSLSYNATTGVISYTQPTNVSTFTNDAAYITIAGARNAISVSGSLSYNASTGVISYTQPTTVSTFTNDAGYITLAQARAGISVAGSLSYNSTTGVISYTQPTNVSAFTNDSGYITTAGARSAISVSGSLSYNSSTGVISYTQPANISAFSNDSGYVTAAGARAALSFAAGSGAYNSSTGVITIPTNTNQLTNGAGFITGYTETDTLATVTGRGATTSTTLILARVVTTGLYGPGGSGNLPIWQYDASNPGYGIVYNEGSPDTLRIDVSGQALTGTPDVLIGGDYMQINGNTVLHAGNYNTYALHRDIDSEQTVGAQTVNWNAGVRRMNTDPRWNESGYDTDLGCLHIWASTNAGGFYGRAGIALYNDSAYQYLTTKSGQSGMFINNTQVVTNSGTWSISISGNSATTSQRSFSGDISTGGMGRFTGWYNGTAATGLATEVGIFAGEGYVIVYNRNSGSYGSLNLNAVNIKIDPQGGIATVSGSQIVTNNGGTWGISISGNASTASVANSVAWSNVSGGVRTNYDLGLQAPSGGGYAGFYWRGSDGVDAGYFLIRSADGDVYTNNGITLVGDRNWVTIASRTTTDKGVRIMAGQTSASRIVAHSSGQVVVGQSAETKFSVDSVAFYVRGGASGWSVFERNGKRIYINANYSDLNTFCQVSSEAVSNMALSLSAREVQEDLYITTGGNVGVGTASPGTRLEILSRAADANRTIPHNVLTITAEQGNAPYGFFGGAILFKNRSYVSGMVESARIRSVIYDDGAPNNFGGGIWLETTPTPGGTLTPSFVLNYQGRVGIGTTSPNTLLNLHGADPFLRINNTSTGDQGIRISFNNLTDSGVNITYNPNSAVAFIENTYPQTAGQAWGDIRFRQNVGGTMTTRMVIRNIGGSVGIGTDAPSNRLHVLGSGTVGRFESTSGTGAIVIAHSGNGGNIGYTNLGTGSQSNVFYITTGAGSVGSGITMDNDGRVAVGTSSFDTGKRININGAWGATITANGANSSDRCWIRDTDSDAYMDFVSYISGGEAYSGSMGIFVRGGKDALIMAGNANIRFVTGGYTEVARATNSQEFLIGYTSDQGNYKLQVNGTIYASGDVIAYSDVSVKTNFRPIKDALKKVLNSNGLIYDRIDNGDKDNIGFIAQELEQNLPELVSVNSDGTKGVKYQNMVAVLTEAIKEQQQQIENHKTEIEELKDLVKQLLNK